MHGAVRPGDGGTFLALAPEHAREFTERLAFEVDRVRNEGVEPVLVCGAPIRASLRRLVVSGLANPPAVIAYTELGAHLQVETVGMVDIDEHVLT
jgi:flagellar biosynthesis protein FlhA